MFKRPLIDPHRLGVTALAVLAAGLIGSIGLVGSTSATVGTGERTVYVSISPCRLMDTRVGSTNIGPRSTPLGDGETYVAAARGANGMCIIPAGAVAVGANVTAVNGTSASFLTVFPADVTAPLASSLNWAAGQGATPNAVTTDLSADGRIGLFNNAGSVDVIVDIVGYYEDHNFDDRYYTKAEVDAKVSHEVIVSNGINAPSPFVPQATFGVAETITATTSGRWQVTKSFWGSQICATASYSWYYLTLDGVPIRSSATFAANSAPPAIQQTLIGTTSAPVTAGVPHTISVAAQCDTGGASATSIFSRSIGSVTVIP